MNAQTVDAIATARLGGLLEPQVARLQVRLMAEMVEQLGTLATAGLGGAKLVTVADDSEFAALTGADVNVGDLVFIDSSAAHPGLSACILQLVTAGSEGVFSGYVVSGNASVAWLSTFLGSSTAAAAAVAIVNGNPIAPSTVGISTNGAASAPPATLTGTWYSGGSGTTTKPQLLIEPTGATSTNWATAGTGLGINSAAGFTGNLLDLKTNNSSTCYINYQGQIQVGLNGNFGTSSGTNMLLEFYNGLRFGNQVGMGVSWSNGTSPNSSVDTGIYRDGIGSIGQRYGATAQGYSIYGTYTSTTNYERLKMCYNSGTTTFQIGTEKGSGGGSARNLEIVVNGNTLAVFDTNRFISLAGDAFGASTSTGKTYLYNAGVLCWNNAATASNTGTADSGISRLSAATFAFGNGTAGDYSGFVQDLYRRKGTGTPEAAVTAPVGSVFHRTDGGAGTSFYVKESGSGNTGWVAK